MFSFGNVIQTIVRVAVAATNVVNTIIQRATGGQGRFAEAAQSFTDTMNHFVGDDSASSRHDDDQSSRPSGTSPEEIRQREQEHKAQAFDDDIDRQRGRDDLQDGADFDVASLERQADLRLDLAMLLQDELIPAELMIAAAGNPVAQSLLQMMRHERPLLDQVMQIAPSVEQGLVWMIGLAEEGDEDTIEAASVYEQGRTYWTDAHSRPSTHLMPPEQIQLWMASDVPLNMEPIYSKPGWWRHFD